MLYLELYDAKYIEKSRSFQNQCVFPLFSDKKKKQLRFCRNCLISNVDQPGLEPGTSRLWVCCSNQLSYKSSAMRCMMGARLVDAKVWRNDEMTKFKHVFLMFPCRKCRKFQISDGIWKWKLQIMRECVVPGYEMLRKRRKAAQKRMRAVWEGEGRLPPT